ncbi:MAG: serine/threonine protein phosphatase [Deltaproteobacteria bacterium]|nr:serine/threonine protein phosphatase [Deltaproteobacteria bacterium]
MGNIFAIGDIHGRMDKLNTLMDKIDIDFEMDTLVFLGDYIDRGPSSFEVISFLITLKEKYENIIFLKGNHEEMLENYIAGIDRFTYLSNGGRQTIDSYMRRGHISGKELIPEDHIDFFKRLDLFYQTDNYIFVHAGLREKIVLQDQLQDDLLWIRQKFIKSNYDFGKRVIFGHTPLAEPLVQPNKIGVDTGAVYGNKLTCVKLPDVVFYGA